MCPKRVFSVQKSEHQILHIQIILGTNFHIKQFCFSGLDLPKTGTSGTKQDK